MSAKVHVGDVGTVFEATIKDQDGAIVDVSTAAVRQMRFKKPDGTLLTKTAVLVNTGTDGKVKYTAIAGDIDQAGEWFTDGYDEIGSCKWSVDVQVCTVAEYMHALRGVA